MVAHYSGWCSHCLTFWPLYYSLAFSYHSVDDLLFTKYTDWLCCIMCCYHINRIDSDKNDLLPCHQVQEFPTIVLYLKNRYRYLLVLIM